MHISIKVLDVAARFSTGLALMAGAAAAQSDRFDVPYDPQYPPLSEQLANGEETGFDIEVARAIADSLRSQIEFAPTTFAQIESDKWPEEWDFAVSSMSWTEERDEVFDFVFPPYYYDQIILVAESKVAAAGLAAVAGQPIGVTDGTIYLLYLALARDGNEDGPLEPEFFGQSQPVTFENEQQLLRTIANPGNGDPVYAITSANVLAHMRRKEQLPLEVVGDSTIINNEAVYITVPADEIELQSEIAEVVSDLRDRRILSYLSVKFLGADRTNP